MGQRNGSAGGGRPDKWQYGWCWAREVVELVGPAWLDVACGWDTARVPVILQGDARGETVCFRIPFASLSLSLSLLCLCLSYSLARSLVLYNYTCRCHRHGCRLVQRLLPLACPDAYPSPAPRASVCPAVCAGEQQGEGLPESTTSLPQCRKNTWGVPPTLRTSFDTPALPAQLRPRPPVSTQRLTGGVCWSCNTLLCRPASPSVRPSACPPTPHLPACPPACLPACPPAHHPPPARQPACLPACIISLQYLLITSLPVIAAMPSANLAACVLVKCGHAATAHAGKEGIRSTSNNILAQHHPLHAHAN